MKDMGHYLRNRFITGIFVILPIGITIWILVKTFNFIDSILGRTITNITGIKIPGLGFLITIGAILGIGVISNNVIGKKIAKWIEDMLVKVPIIKMIYNPIKDIMKNFSSNNSNNFKRAVMVSFPSEKSKSIGFITKENIKVEEKFKTAVFVPTTPNPTSGFLVYLDKEDYKELDMTVESALKTIISLGSVSPNEILIKKDTFS